MNNASSNGKLRVVECLHETCHAKIEVKDKKGNTPIYNASQNGHIQVAKYLYETCHAKVKASDSWILERINNYSSIPPYNSQDNFPFRFF